MFTQTLDKDAFQYGAGLEPISDKFDSPNKIENDTKINIVRRLIMQINTNLQGKVRFGKHPFLLLLKLPKFSQNAVKM